MPDFPTLVATAFEVSLLLAGLILIWRVVLRPAVRRQPAPVALARWDAPLGEFFMFLCLLFGGGAAASLGAGIFLKYHPLEGDAKIAVLTAATQMGMVGGIGLFRFFFDRHRMLSAKSPHHFTLAGLTTFLIVLPVVSGVSIAWQELLQVCGLPAEKQDLVRMFLDAKSTAFLTTMIFLACIGAPVMEELIFRAGLFRYARTRLPRWAALLVPACIFAALHMNLATFGPLVALGIVFSLAYERTGNIGTTIVAHALFNLNSIVVIFSKVDV